MSIRRAFLVVLLFLPAAIWFSSTLDRLFLDREIIGSSRVGSIGRARGRIVHVLTEERWTRFRIPARSTGAKVIVYAACESNGVEDPEGEIRFAIRYRLVDRDGGVRREQDHWFRSRVSRLSLGEGRETLRRAFFLEPDIVPTDGRSSILDVGDPENLPQFLDVQLGEHDPRVVDAVGRFFFQERVTSLEGEERWERMGRTARERAIRASVYSADLLSDYERAHLASTRWSRVAPEGIGGEDYDTRRLYIVSGDNLRAAETERSKDAVVVDSHIHGVLHIPESGANVRLLFSPIEDSEVSFVSAELRWYGRRASEVTSTIVGIPTRGGVVERPFEGGTVEVRSTARLEMRYQVLVDEAWTTPSAVTSRLTLYSVDDTRDVVFAVHRSPGHESVLRLSLRAWLGPTDEEEEARRFSGRPRVDVAADESAEPTESTALTDEPDPDLEAEHGSLAGSTRDPTVVEIEWLREDGSVERVLPVEVPPVVSEHDFVAGIGSRVPVSEPTVLYLRPSDATRSYRVRGIDGRTLASGSTALSPESRDTRVPEDSYAFERDSRDPTWLSVRPWNRQEILEQSGVVTVLAQTAPRERKEWLLNGDFRVESVDPAGPWSGRFLLLPLEERGTETEEDEASPLELVEVPLGDSTEIEILPLASERPLRFFYERAPYDGRFGVCRVAIEHEPTREITLFGEFGEAQLDGLVPGLREMRVDGSDLERVFIEGARIAEKPRFRRRFAARLANTTVFDYRKRSLDEVSVLFKVYLAASSPERVLACVRIESPRTDALATAAWTPTVRSYDLRADLPADVRVVGDRGLLLRRARSFAVFLGRDVPAGRCSITLTLPDSVTAYGYAYEIVPGRDDTRRIVLGSRDAD